MMTSNVVVWFAIAALVLTALLGLAAVVYIALRGADSHDRPQILLALAAMFAAIRGWRS